MTETKPMATYLFEFTTEKYRGVKFSNVAEERRHRKQRLAASFHVMVKFEFGDSAPFMSVRDPENTDIMWMNPWEMPVGTIKSSDLIAIDINSGTLVEGKGILNQSAIQTMSEVLRHRKDVNSVAHAHPKYSTAWSCLNRLLEPIGVDSCIFHEEHIIFDESTRRQDSPAKDGPLTDTGLGKSLGRFKAAFLLNHGALTVGATAEECIFLMTKLEKSCELQTLVESTGAKYLKINSDQIKRYKSTIWQPPQLWWGGNNLINNTIKEQPQLLE